MLSKNRNLFDFDFHDTPIKLNQFARVLKLIEPFLQKIQTGEKQQPFMDTYKDVKDKIDKLYQKAELNKDVPPCDENKLLEKYYTDLIKRTDGNVSEAARIAGHKDSTFRARLEKHGINVKK